ncbi:MAG: hypothetical protein KF729_37415, partial [Sandaracinaceae bacterium]|nr:hypothetical protein [Sandaracinaceae bacterium]
FGTPQPGFGAPNTPAPPGGPPPGGFGAPPPGGGFGAPPPPAQPQAGFGAPPAAAMAPPKKKSKTGLYIGLGCVALLLFGCIGTGIYLWWAANRAVDAVNETLEQAGQDLERAGREAAENAAAAESAAAGGGGGGGACSRIAGCCRGYIDAMGGTVPASTCDAYNNVVGMQDSLCEQTIAGYRSGLSAMNKTIPADCN